MGQIRPPANPKHTFAPSGWDLGRISPQRSGSAGAAQMSLIAELKRRNVFRVGVAYAIVAWVSFKSCREHHTSPPSR